MSATFTLWDTETANLVGDYPSELAALRDVLGTVRRNGANSDAIASLALVRDDVPANQGLIASGQALAKLAADRLGHEFEDRSSAPRGRGPRSVAKSVTAPKTPAKLPRDHGPK